MQSPSRLEFEPLVRRALAEDIGDGDYTSLWTVPENALATASFVAKRQGVIAGLSVVDCVFSVVDAACATEFAVADGATVKAGDRFGRVSGPARALLAGERTALNFLQRLSGIATATRAYVDAVAGTRAIILDTRKTVPGLRLLDKWAVVAGGGQNHRVGLFDMILIKDNHIRATGGIAAAVRAVQAANAKGLQVEVEVTNLDELREALALPVDRIMLDNMDIAQMAAAVRLTAGRVPLEASGNVTLDTVRAIAETGVDYISIGALTHSVRALDISMDFD